ncbi:hypothetical protein Aple_061410 [Acrocarpospora pleiomorpha]|uniref:Integrase SAM-like N-terminal domain-containing protein n=1 Tax=Acrocarpospora pleiomorpha TaxID=90975 RepID=A0A5M3XQE7_9ACTN|nr:hypothetical protein [Acrocarpospora pleiomorpha]GES23242.1 hypothetical protein Aple_061410 [Acrocarpospora pleiomorpha]
MASIKRIRLGNLKNGKPPRHVARPGRQAEGQELPAAEAFRAEIEAAKNKGQYLDPHAGKILFRDYAESGSRRSGRQGALGTFTAYIKRLKGHIRPTFDNSSGEGQRQRHPGLG